MGGPHHYGQCFIDHLPRIRVHNPAVPHPVGFQIAKSASLFPVKNLIGDCQSVWAAEAHNANAPFT
jgi:hypothetical protein